MNKADLIDALSNKENLTAKDAFEIVNIVFDGFTNALKKDGRIEIRGFGGRKGEMEKCCLFLANGSQYN